MLPQEKSLKHWRSKTNKLLNEYNLAKQQIRIERDALEQCKKNTKAILKAQHILQNIAQQVQESAHKKIALIVTRCLEVIWEGEAYEFRFNFVRKRGRTEAVPNLLRNGNTIEDPLYAAGGSVCQVVAFALRVATLIFTTPKPRKILLLDEPFAMLSNINAAKVGAMLLELSKELDLQIIMATHNEELKIGNVIEV